MVKQADVNLLAFPLGLITDKAQIEKDVAYYEPRLAPDGPAMGFGVIASLYAQMGQKQKAYEVFTKSYRPNFVPPFNVLAETAGGTNPYFATGAGGLLQTVMFGFGGMQITDAGLVQGKQYLPKQWKKIRVTGVEQK